MNYKFSLKNNLHKRLPVYLFFCIGVPFILSMLLISKNSLKRNQIISFFIVSNGVKNQSQLVTETKALTQANAIRRVNVNFVSPNSESFDSQFTTVGLKNSDIIILPKSKVEEGSEPYCYNEILDTNKFYDSSNYVYRDKHYGICVHNKSISFLNDYIEYGDDDYYVFLPTTSPHMNGFVETSGSNSVMLILEGLLK